MDILNRQLEAPGATINADIASLTSMSKKLDIFPFYQFQLQMLQEKVKSPKAWKKKVGSLQPNFTDTHPLAIDFTSMIQ